MGQRAWSSVVSCPRPYFSGIGLVTSVVPAEFNNCRRHYVKRHWECCNRMRHLSCDQNYVFSGSLQPSGTQDDSNMYALTYSAKSYSVRKLRSAFASTCRQKHSTYQLFITLLRFAQVINYIFAMFLNLTLIRRYSRYGQLKYIRTCMYNRL